MKSLSKIYDSPKELADYIQDAMLFMILLLEYESEHTCIIVKCYEQLYILQKELINNNKKTK